MSQAERRPAPTVGRIVRYQDPLTGEALAAIVAKVHSPGEPDGRINLTYCTQEGLTGPACDVPYGPGAYGHWYWPDYSTGA